MKKGSISKLVSAVVSAALITAAVTGCAVTPAPSAQEKPSEVSAAEEETGSEQEETGNQSTESEIEEPSQETEAQTEPASDEGTESNGAEEAEESSQGPLPAYEYPGPEAFYYDLYKYIIDEFSANYEKADVCIPSVDIVAEDTEDPEDYRVYGIFSILNYNLNGDILECVSGGLYPGVIHARYDQENGSYEFTGSEIVEDGSNYTESAKRIFGDHYSDFEKLYADDKAREQTRAQIIANYVAANDLQITAYKDYGWDPVTLPQENIDSFYSILD